MTGERKMPDIILISGGFDPIHSGHIKLIEEASTYGSIVVLLNSDKWLQNKSIPTDINLTQRGNPSIILKTF